MTRRARPALGAAVLLAGLASCGAGGGPSVPSAGSSTAPAANATASSPTDPLAALRPPIRQWRIPFGPRRKREMVAYAYRHANERAYSYPHCSVHTVCLCE